MMSKQNFRLWSNNKFELYSLGIVHVTRFCHANNINTPKFHLVDKADWPYPKTCAYYRPEYIKICLAECGWPCVEAMSRNWTWPASTTDREPYGVLCHELGHHCDMIGSLKSRYAYSGDYGESVRAESGELPLTSYAAGNDAEWFAEAFRLFVTNHALLKLVRPKTHEILIRSWKPISNDNYLYELGNNVPARVLKALDNKMVRV